MLYLAFNQVVKHSSILEKDRNKTIRKFSGDCENLLYNVKIAVKPSDIKWRELICCHKKLGQTKYLKVKLLSLDKKKKV